MAKVFKHVGLWLAVLFAALCTAGLLVVHAQGEDNALYQTVLGKAVNFGITAGTLNHESDLQTNFATKHYTNVKGQHANPNLTGTTTPGDFLIGQMDHDLKITEGPSANSTYYVTQKDVAKVKRDNQNEQANANTDYTKDQINGYVDNMINSALSEGGTLAGKAATANVVIKTGQYDDKVTIDTTALGDNETIYVDPSSNAKCHKALSTNGNLTIKKKPNQNIVFNITTAPSSGTTLDLVKYAIKTTDGQSFDTTPDTNPSKINTRLDAQAKHIFFNVRSSSGIKNVTLTNTAGIFLLQDADASVGGTSSGWIVTNKSFTNNGGEWHYIHPSPSPWSPTTTTEKTTGSLELTKISEGHKTPENATFTITKKVKRNQPKR